MNKYFKNKVQKAEKVPLKTESNLVMQLSSQSGALVSKVYSLKEKFTKT